MLVCLILAQMSLRLSSILFILFSLFRSSAVISTFRSSSSPIQSASVILLLIPSRVFLISVIVFYLCLLILYFFYVLVIVLTVLIVSCLFSILFSSLWSIFTVIILSSVSGRLLISSLCVWSCKFLPCSFICTVFLCLFIIFLTCSTWGLLFPGFGVVFLLPLGFCPWRERLVEWFVLTSFWGDVCLCSNQRRPSWSSR